MTAALPARPGAGFGHVAVGAFVVCGAALAVAAVLVFGTIRIFHPPLPAVVVFQGAVNGLAIGAPVTFRGVNVGSVTRIVIEFDRKTHTAFIPVTVELQGDNVRITQQDQPADLRGMIARGLRAELNTQSFVTGQAEIDLDFDPDTPAVLHPDMTDALEIPMRESKLNKVKDQIADLPLRELASNANAALKSLRTLADTLGTSLPPLIASVNATSDRSGEAVTALAAQASVMLAAVSKAAATGDRVIDQRGAELHLLLATTSQAMLQARDVLGDVRGLTSSRSAARVNAEAALSDLASASAALRGFASDVEHDPRLLLTGRRP